MTSRRTQSVVRFGVFELDARAGELRKEGLKINLQQQPLQLLALLVRRPGEVVSREELQQALWPADTFVEFDHGLNTAIRKIRQALEDTADNPRFIETLPRKGYRFIAPVSEVEAGIERFTPERFLGRRLWMVTAVIVLAVAAGAAGWLLKQRDNSSGSIAPAPVPLTSYPGMAWCPSFSPDGNQVVFQLEQSEERAALGPTEIDVKLVGASEARRITDGFCPAWSPDGRTIAFVRFAPKAAVFLISPLGGPERKLADLDFTFTFDYVPRVAWHPSGKWLVVLDRGSPDEPLALFSLSLENREKRRLTSPKGGLYDVSPAVSADGRALAFARCSKKGECGLYALELSDEFQPKGEPIQLAAENAYNDVPAWTPDGRALVFSSGTINAPSLFEVAFALPGQRPGKPQRLAFAGYGVRTPTISRQGRLAYGTLVVNTDVWRLELNGGHATLEPAKPLISSSRLDHMSEYSADGKRLIFASDRSGSHEIWVCNSDGSGARPLTSFGGFLWPASPHWAPDGRLILFDYNPEGRPETYAVDVDGGKPRRLLENVVVDSWSHDGHWIYYAAGNQVWKRPWPLSGNSRDAVQITHLGGNVARESPDGRLLYYQKTHDEGTSLWKVPVQGGEEAQVLESICCQSFAVIDEGIYFVFDPPPWDDPSIQYLSFATGKVERIANMGDPTYGFSISPDGRWLLYSQYQPVQADLWMVENFR